MVRFRKFWRFLYLLFLSSLLQAHFLFANVAAAEHAFDLILEELSQEKEDDLEALEDMLRNVDLGDPRDKGGAVLEELPLRSLERQSRLSPFVSDSKREQLDYPLRHCRDDVLGIKVLCDPRWDMKTQGEAMMLVISKTPAVTCTLTKIDADVRLIEQITKSDLVRLGEYQSGFQTEYVSINNLRALKVKAFSKVRPEMRVDDYYVLSAGNLYGILFSVQPRDQWDNYKFVMRRMMESVRFFDPDASTTPSLSAR